MPTLVRPQHLAAAALSLTADPSRLKVRGVDWAPNPGRQTEAYESPADILGYGGGAGGGKTNLMIGLAVTRHRRSVIFRREKTQVRDIWDKLVDLCGVHGRSNENYLVVRGLPGDRQVELAGLKNDGDWRRYQGREYDLHCVALGTPILMGDGSYKHIERVRKGDRVATLQGPKVVTRLIPKGIRSVVSVIAGGAAVLVTPDHHLLGASAWVSPDDARRSTRSDAALSMLEWCQDSFREGGRPELGLPSDRARRSEEAAQGHWKMSRESDASGAGSQSGSAGSGGLLQEVPLPERWFAPLVLLERAARPSQLGSVVAFDKRVPWHDDGESGSLGSPSGYRASRHFGGGQLRSRAQVSAQDNTQQLGGVVLLDRTDERVGDHGRTPRYIRVESLRYCHPYTKADQVAAEAVLATVAEMAPAGEAEVFDLTVDGANHYISYGGMIHQNCFDEATEFTESQVRTLIAWNRTTLTDQRTRVVLGFNPPTSPEGEWVINFFGPWLDPQHPYPAEPGELRFYATLDHGDGRGARDTECYGPDGFDWHGDWVTPKSRTFIPALLDDNPYLLRTNYRAQLQGLPEPLRSQLLFGDMAVGTTDDEWQVIPTDWVRQAQARWLSERPRDLTGKLIPCTRVGIDVAQGGRDFTVISKRYSNWFAPLERYAGSTSPDATVNADRILKSLALEDDRTPATIDANGIGAATFFLLRPKLRSRVSAILGHMPATATDRSGTLEFANLRAQAYWTLREWLDPNQGYNLALPPGRELLADLCAPRWSRRSGKIALESKDDIKARIGRSPDDGDALVNTLLEYTGVYQESLEFGRGGER